jgi:hypothetical protein
MRFSVDDILGVAVAEQGRNEQPLALYWQWRFGDLTTDGLRENILDVWQVAEWPSVLGHGAWLEMFTATGCVSDDGEYPPSPTTVYRGGMPRHMRGFSWTTDIEPADWFARRTALLGFPAEVYEATVTTDRILGVINGGRGESEIILNPRRLRGRWTPRLMV